MLRRIAFIVFAQRVGLTLEEIGAELAKLPGDHVPTRRDWARLSTAWGGRIAERIAPHLAEWPYVGPYSDTAAFIIVVAIITYFSLVIGELIPKRLALNSAEAIAGFRERKVI